MGWRVDGDLRLGRGAQALPRGGHHRGDVREADPPRESRQDVGEVLDRVHLGQSAAAQHREGDGCALTTGVASREEEVLPRDRRADVEALHDTVVDGDDAVVEEASERHLVVGEVLDGFAHR